MGERPNNSNSFNSCLGLLLSQENKRHKYPEVVVKKKVGFLITNMVDQIMGTAKPQ
jgi:hypothetical protein